MNCKFCIDVQMDKVTERIIYPIVSSEYYWCPTCGAFLTVITEAKSEPTEMWLTPLYRLSFGGRLSNHLIENGLHQCGTCQMDNGKTGVVFTNREKVNV